MLASPCSFYHGGAAVMATDLATTAASGIRVQTCGDAGVLSGSEGKLRGHRRQS
jgi:hypothetical protein